MQNGNNGFLVFGGPNRMTIDSSVAHGNGLRGLWTSAGSIARISNSTFTDNGEGIRNSGNVETRGNNTVRGNGTDLAGNPLTPIGGI